MTEQGQIDWIEEVRQAADLKQLADRLDQHDPLSELRDQFALDPDLIYLDGNSLGPLPRATSAQLGKAVEEEWGVGLVTSWNRAGWYELPLTLGDRLAPLLGAGPGQVAICDTTTLNLFKALSAALELRPQRQLMLVDGGEFPANLYISEGVQRIAARPIERLVLGASGVALDPVEAIDQLAVERPGELAVVALSQVNYRTGRLLDLPAITRVAHQAGALVVWDLCHSAGVLTLQLDQDQVDFAVGCTYKYLNGGPGAPAYIYVAQHHLGSARQPLSGWMGHAQPFEFDASYQADPGIRGFLCGTPHILSMRAISSALDLYQQADLTACRLKSMRLTELFREAVERGTSRAEENLRLLSPRDPLRRGAQVTFAHRHGLALVQALIEQRVVGDFRAPDGMRFGFAPLVVTHRQAVQAAQRLCRCVDLKAWEDPRFSHASTVT